MDFDLLASPIINAIQPYDAVAKSDLVNSPLTGAERNKRYYEKKRKLFSPVSIH